MAVINHFDPLLPHNWYNVSNKDIQQAVCFLLSLFFHYHFFIVLIIIVLVGWKWIIKLLWWISGKNDT